MERLAALPTHDVEPRLRDRIRREALHELRREHAMRDHPARRRLRRAYDRALEPGLLAVGSAAYLTWAVMEVLAILGL